MLYLKCSKSQKFKDLEINQCFQTLLWCLLLTTRENNCGIIKKLCIDVLIHCIDVLIH